MMGPWILWSIGAAIVAGAVVYLAYQEWRNRG